MSSKRKTHSRRQAECALVKNHPAFYISDDALSLIAAIAGGLVAGYLFCAYFGILPML